MKLNSCSTKDYENKSGLLTTAKQTQSNPILSASGGFKRRGSDYSAAGDEVVFGVIEDKALAGTGGELRLVEFDGHHTFIYLNELTRVGIDIRADFAEELTACNKFFGDKNVEPVCRDNPKTYFVPGAQCDGVFLCIDFAHVKWLTAGKTNTSSLAERIISDSFMCGYPVALHICYVTVLIKSGVGQDGAVVAFSGKT
jgi:hypothetical protein